MSRSEQQFALGYTGSYPDDYHREHLQRLAYIPGHIAHLLVKYHLPESSFKILLENKSFIVVHADDRLSLAVYHHDFSISLYIADKLQALPRAVMANASRQHEKRKKIIATEYTHRIAKPSAQLNQDYNTAYQISDKEEKTLGWDVASKNERDAIKAADEKFAQATASDTKWQADALVEAQRQYEEAIAPAMNWHHIMELPHLLGKHWLEQDGLAQLSYEISHRERTLEDIRRPIDDNKTLVGQLWEEYQLAIECTDGKYNLIYRYSPKPR